MVVSSRRPRVASCSHDSLDGRLNRPADIDPRPLRCRRRPAITPVEPNGAIPFASQRFVSSSIAKLQMQLAAPPQHSRQNKSKAAGDFREGLRRGAAHGIETLRTPRYHEPRRAVASGKMLKMLIKQAWDSKQRKAFFDRLDTDTLRAVGGAEAIIFIGAARIAAGRSIL
jgi:hypothetical protein